MTEKPDLIEVLASYGIDVKDGRAEQLALCVSHSESKPSMSVNVLKGLVHCHACGFRGDSLTIIMERESIDYPAAIAVAAEKYGVVPAVRAGRGRVGLSGASGPGRGGYRPAALRKGLNGSSS